MTRLVVAPYVAPQGGYRITLTLPVLNEAAAILVLVAGRDKARMLRTALESDERANLLPIQLVWPRSGTLSWLADPAAACLLRPSTLKGDFA